MKSYFSMCVSCSKRKIGCQYKCKEYKKDKEEYVKKLKTTPINIAKNKKK